MEQSQVITGTSSYSAKSAGLVGELAVVSACAEESPQREALEQYISGIFSTAYDARIMEYLPLLFSLEARGSYSAALGLRSAAVAPLFCEQYLDSRVEQEALSLYGANVDRRRMMELGNLVASSSGQSALLYLLITAALHQAGIEYLLFAANKPVRASIRRSGFTPKVIRVAEKNRLGEQAKNWGTYYQGEPIVMLADIALTMDQARVQPFMCDVFASYRHAIPVLADAIGKHIP